MKSERYTVKQFNQQFADDSVCLEYIWQQRFPNGLRCPKCHKVDAYSRVTTRKCYSCECGHQVSPCEGTIFHKSRTPLKTWFYAMFLMTASKNGVSAKELERLTGVTYKTAFRMAHQIRKLMQQGGEMLSGIVEADEAYVGGLAKNMHKKDRVRKITGSTADKIPVLGLMQRDGLLKAKVVDNTKSVTIIPNIVENVQPGSRIFSDEFQGYKYVAAAGYKHDRIAHSLGEYVRAEVHTNSIEGFWGQLKRSVNGTFHQVSPKHLQAYVDEFAFRYNRRAAVTEAPIFPMLAERAGERRD